MLNTEQDLEHFEAAKKVALSIGLKLRRRASAKLENPFWGANVPGLGPAVLWLTDDAHLTGIQEEGGLIADSVFFYFKKVQPD